MYHGYGNDYLAHGPAENGAAASYLPYHPSQQPQPAAHNHPPFLDDPRFRTQTKSNRQFSHRHRCVIGEPGYPAPSPERLGRVPFTFEDNEKLKDLKERTNPALSWRQIGDFFPGRTPNTLQVHYSTKLKGVVNQWTPNLDKQLRAVVKEDEKNKAKRVARAFAGVFSPEDCEARMKLVLARTPSPDTNGNDDHDDAGERMQNGHRHVHVDGDDNGVTASSPKCTPTILTTPKRRGYDADQRQRQPAYPSPPPPPPSLAGKKRCVDPPPPSQPSTAPARGHAEHSSSSSSSAAAGFWSIV